jgi:hypothetical protein
VILHVVWSTIVLAAAALALTFEASAPCPPGGPLSFGACAQVRPLSMPVTGLAALLYVAGLSSVLAWARRLHARGVADSRAVRDWYALAASLGLPVSILLAFTLVSALR